MAFEPIAIVGRGCVLPGALSPEALWEVVARGCDLTSDPASDDWGLDPAGVIAPSGAPVADKTWGGRGGYVRGFEAVWDPDGFALDAADLEGLDKGWLWLLHAARAAWREGGGDALDLSRTGVIVGNLSYPSRALAALACDVWRGEDDISPARARNRFVSGYPAALTAQAFGLGGPAFSLDAACASSLYAIKHACDLLHARTCDGMLVGALNACDNLFLHLGFTALGALSKSGCSRPLSRSADGLLPAEGAAAVLLMRAADVDPARDNVLGIVRGVGVSNDGRRRGLLAPDADGQREAIERAYGAAGVAPETVSLLECHATGTPTGDPIEITTLARVFARCDELPVGSLKSNTGHLITVAGLGGLLKLLGALEHETLPPTINAEDAIDAFAEGPARPILRSEPWPAGDKPRRAGLSAFGFGGSNAHLVLEEAARAPAFVSAARPTPSLTEEIVICGAGASAGPAQGMAAILGALEADPPDAPARTRRGLTIDLARAKLPPRDLDRALAQQLWMFEVAEEALTGVATDVAPERAGVFVGMGCDAEAARWAMRWREAISPEDKDGVVPALDAAAVLGAMPNVPANRLNGLYDWRGVGHTVSSEELSGLDALTLAARALANGELDIALVAAADLSDEPVHTAATRALGKSEPPGDAAAALVLKRRADALRDGDPILATLDLDAWDKPRAARDEKEDDKETQSDALAARFGVAHAAASLLSVAIAAAAGAGRHALDGGRLRAQVRGPEDAALTFSSLTGRAAHLRLGFDAPAAPVAAPRLGATGSPAPLIALYAAEDAADLAKRLDTDFRGGGGPQRLALVAQSADELASARERAAAALRGGQAPAGRGVAFRESPIDGDVALMFTGAAAAYPGMGGGVFAAFPEALDAVAARFDEADDVARLLARDPGRLAAPFEQLRATTLLSQVHAEIAFSLLKTPPCAAIGLSSGETNALLAFRAWRDPDALLADVRQSEMYARWLAGRCETARDAWSETGEVEWRNWRVLAPYEDVARACANEPRAEITIVHGANDCIIGGAADACARVLEAVGAGRAAPLGQDLIVHCAALAPFAETWRAIHSRSTFSTPGVRFYANATNAAYVPTRATAAEMITAQAAAPIDVSKTIRQAWDDGVRAFIEMGPRDTLANAAREALAGKLHVAVSFDRFGADGLGQIVGACAALWTAGVEIDVARLSVLCDRLRAAAPPEPRAPHTVAAHPPPVRAPRPAKREAPLAAETLPQAEVFVLPQAPQLARTAHVAVGAVASGTLARAAEPVIMTPAPQIAPVNRSLAPAPPALRAAPRPEMPARRDDNVGGDTDAAPGQAASGETRAPRGPSFDRSQLEAAARGKISDLFGPAFARQDGYRRQVRMPAPPLLLADRVTGIDAAPGERGAGTIWTETDVVADAWHMHLGRMRPGIVIESGQADLLLASYMGVDFLNKDERVYRLLGCELTFHDRAPRAGETLKFQINIERHAALGDVRLFFFNYDACAQEGEDSRPILSVRGGQAGFFTDDELTRSGGVVWNPETARPPTATPRLAALPNASAKRAFSKAELDAWFAGNAYKCFGAGFEFAGAHQRTPRPPAGRMRMIDSVDAFEPTGGPWKRGYLRAAAAAPRDAWFYEGHFHNDPCMPGTLMAEAAVQAVETFMAASGLTIDRDGWRFEPASEETYKFICRGQVVPDADHRLTYEVFVDEIFEGSEPSSGPTVYAALLAKRDGFKVFYCPRFGVRLVRDWPISDRPEADLLDAAPVVVSPPAQAENALEVRGDQGALLACAWGRPSDAFGPMYARFDHESSVPRLPGPPYHAVSRIISVNCPPGAAEENARVVAEYDPPADAWYFDENASAVMPLSVLMEVLLQPCGWLASYCGFALEGGLAFRNLDGADAVMHAEVPPEGGPLRTEATLTGSSKAGALTLVRFDVACTRDGEPVMSFSTSFGFFSKSALAAQAGLPTDDTARALLSAPSDRFLLASAARRRDRARLPRGRLKMIDAVTGFWPTGGEAGLGRIRGRQAVDPSAWYFKAHFYEDPVQPGSLGVDALLQLLERALLNKGLDREFVNPRFEAPALGAKMTWKYRGQVAPNKKEVITTLDLTELTVRPREVFATAKASLWVDGLRIYEVEGLSARIVEGATPPIRAMRLNPANAPWLDDHRPTYTVPALPMAGAIKAAATPALEHAQARLGAAFPFLLEDFRLNRWIVADDVEVGLDARAVPRGAGRYDLELFADGALVGEGRARAGVQTELDDDFKDDRDVGFDLGELASVDDLYADDALFHGPQFHLLTDVMRSDRGATASLDVARAFEPEAELDIGLLDALLHAIPHNAPETWFGASAAGKAAYPYRIERLVLHRRRPRTDLTRVSIRPLELDAAGRLARLAVRAEDAEGLWLELRLLEALMPKGPIGQLEPRARRAFLEGRFVEGAGLTSEHDGQTTLALSDVKASDWLPGTLERAYRLRSEGDERAREIAIKEHVGRLWRAHPREVDVEGDLARRDEQSLRVSARFDTDRNAWLISTTDAP